MGAWDWMKFEGETNLKEKVAKHNRETEVAVSTPYALKETSDLETNETFNIEPVDEPYVPIKYKPVSISIKSYTPEQIAEYAEIAEVVGVAPADLKIEEFKTYLRGKEFPVYDLDTVVSFMDAKSKAEGRGWGWNWVPLRDKDRITASFGKEAERREIDRWSRIGASGQLNWIGEDRPASDHYASHVSFGVGHVKEVQKYDKVVPLHALKKVAMIEREFKHSVAFMVSDYAPAPEFKADPFLMVVINNSNLNAGDGRFVIDVWDEPGFGIDQMIKSGL